MSLTVTRFFFGVGEAAALPAGRRAFRQGLQHAGSRLGAAVTPPIVIFLIAYYGWRYAFFVFGIVGVVLAAVWVAYFRNTPEQHPQVNAVELAILRPAGWQQPAATAKQKESAPWRQILRSRDLWFLGSMYFCYGWVLWLYLNWLPTYLVEMRNFTQITMGMATSLPLLAGALTNIAGGTLSDRLVHAWGDLRCGRVVVSVCGFLVAGSALVLVAPASSAGAALACLGYRSRGAGTHGGYVVGHGRSVVITATRLRL